MILAAVHDDDGDGNRSDQKQVQKCVMKEWHTMRVRAEVRDSGLSTDRSLHFNKNSTARAYRVSSSFARNWSKLTLFACFIAIICRPVCTVQLCEQANVPDGE